MDNETLTPIIKSLIARSAMPLKALETDFAVDSTGFGTMNFYRHYSAKYGASRCAVNSSSFTRWSARGQTS